MPAIIGRLAHPRYISAPSLRATGVSTEKRALQGGATKKLVWCEFKTYISEGNRTIYVTTEAPSYSSDLHNAE
jgi:hypothetical protein